MGFPATGISASTHRFAKDFGFERGLGFGWRDGIRVLVKGFWVQSLGNMIVWGDVFDGDDAAAHGDDDVGDNDCSNSQFICNL
jgi:hypothetical protein